MRILQVNKLYYPTIGGVEQVVQNVAEGMVGHGHDVSVVAARESGFGQSFHHNGVEVTKTACPGRLFSVPLSPTFPFRVAAATRKYDVIHHHLPNPLSPASDFLVESATPVVVTYHSDIVRQSRALRLYRPLLERFLERVDRIIVTSPRLRDQSSILAPYREKCTVIPLSLDVDAYDEHDGDSDALPVGADDRVVLFVGRLNYYKGVSVLVDAMSDVGAELLVVGDGDRRDSLGKRVSQRGLDDSVHFIGHVPSDTLQACYDRADVFVLPSVVPSEAFGLVQLEAMAHGTPVVNTDLPTGVPWVSRDGETGLTVPPNDSEALADALETLLADAEQRRTLGERARERVSERFGRERMLSDLETLYDEVVK